MNKILASGNGKYCIAGIISYSIGLIIDIFALVFGLQNMYLYRFRGEAWPILLVIAGIAGLAYSLYKIAIEALAYNTTIAVYENEIKGHGQIGKFSLPQEFSISISNIHNIDILKGGLNKTAFGIVVHTQYAKYTCYMKNSDEVRDKIMELVNGQKASI